MVLKILWRIWTDGPSHCGSLAVGEPCDLFILKYPWRRLPKNLTFLILVFDTVIDDCREFLEQLVDPLRSQCTVTLKEEVSLIGFQVDFTDFAGSRHRPTWIRPVYGAFPKASPPYGRGAPYPTCNSPPCHSDSTWSMVQGF